MTTSFLFQVGRLFLAVPRIIGVGNGILSCIEGHLIITYPRVLLLVNSILIVAGNICMRPLFHPM